MALLRRVGSASTAPEEHHLDRRREITIGRSPDCDIVVAESDASRKHATIAATADGFRITDNNSQNGVFVGGNRVSSQLLRDGDAVRIGTTDFRFIDPPDLDKTVTFQLPGTSDEKDGTQPGVVLSAVPCLQCGKAIAPDSCFCPECGKSDPFRPLAPSGRICARCGATSSATSHFCRSCGTPLDAPSPPISRTPAPAGPAIVPPPPPKAAEARAVPPPPQPQVPVPAPAQAAPGTQQPAPVPPKKKGCNGCLVGCLIAAAAVGMILVIAYAWWADPPWLRRFEFWRAKPNNAAAELGGLGEEAKKLESDDQIVITSRQQVAEQNAAAHLRTASIVKQTVARSSGATLKTREGAKLTIRPRTFRKDVDVELAPRVTPSTAQRSAGYQIVSDVVTIRVDGQPHTTFDEPVTVELPVVMTQIDGTPIQLSDLTPMFWDETSDIWQPYGVPFQLEDNNVLRFSITHATDVTVGRKRKPGDKQGWLDWAAEGIAAGGVGVVKAIANIGGIRSELQPYAGWAPTWDGPYKTANFAIYYIDPKNTISPGDRVFADSEYPLARGRKSGDTPLQIIDVGEALESAHATAARVGLTPASSLTRERFTVFLQQGGAFGESPLGGPIYLDARMEGVDAECDWGEFLMTTAAHEYMHVLQDEYHNFWVGFPTSRAGGWIETSAQALAEQVRYKGNEKAHPSPFMTTRHYINKEPGFISTGIDSEGSGDKSSAYAWGTFFLWMENDGDVPGVTAKTLANKSNWTNVSRMPEVIADSIPQAKRGATFADRFDHFAQAYLHDDAWDNRMHTKAWWTDRANQAKLTNDYPSNAVFQHVAAGGKNPRYFRSRTIAGLDRMTAQFQFYDAELIPVDDAPGKLIVRIKNVAKSGAALFVYRDEYEKNVPKGARTAPEQAQLEAGKETILEIKDYGTAPRCHAGHCANRVSLIVVNDKPDEDGLDATIDAWLLLPPESVMYDKRKSPAGGSQYTVTWNPSPLEEQKRTESNTPFAGYNVYRRLAGTNAWPEAPLNRVPFTATNYEDTPPDAADYEYAMTVVDTDKRESEKSRIESTDPFVGEWSGSFRLKEGHLADTAAMTEEQKRDYAPLLKLVDKAEVFVKMIGIPVRFQLYRSDGRYRARFLSILGKPVDPKDSEAKGSFKRITEHNLLWEPEEKPEKPVPPVYFSLEYPDEIINTYTLEKLTLEWHFKRGATVVPADTVSRSVGFAGTP